MKCPICGKDVELLKKQVGVDELGEPIFHQYAICKDCKKQWNLSKQRDKKVTVQKQEDAPVKKAQPVDASQKTKVRPDNAPQKAKAQPDNAPRKTKVASPEAVESKETAKKAGDGTGAQRYGNIPSEQVRANRESAVKKGYEEMLAADPKKAKAAKKAKKSAPVKEKPEPEEIDEYDDMEEATPRFRVIRVILGILSVFAFAYFIYRGILAGLDDIAAGNSGIGGLPYIVLALCMLIAGLLLLIMQRKNTVFAFLLPMFFYLGSAVYAFLMRAGDSMLLYGAIAGATLAVIFLILAIASRGQDDDYDDAFDDDYE